MSEAPSTQDNKISDLVNSVSQPRSQHKSGLAPVKMWRRFHAATPFGSNVTLTLGCNVLFGALALITGPLSARLLGPSGRGELAAIQNLYWLVGTLSLLGMPEATLYFTARREREPRRIMSSGMVVALLACPVFYLLTYHLVPMLLAAQPPRVAITARGCILGIPLYVLCLVPLYSLRGNNDLAWWNLMRAVPAFGWLLLLVVLPFFVVPTSTAIAFGYLGMLTLALAPTLWVIVRRIPGSFAPDPTLWPRMLKYGIPIGGSAIPILLNLRLDQMLMAALLPSRSLGLYVVAVAWSGLVTHLLYAIGTVLFPRVASAVEPSRGALLAQGCRVSMISAMLLALLVAAATPVAIPLLFGRAFQDSVAVSIVLVFAAVISGMNVVCEEGLRGIGETPIVFWGEAAGLLITALALAILLRPLGIMGAGIASVTGYLATLVFLLIRICNRTSQSMRDLLVLKSDDLNLIFQKIRLLRGSMGTVGGDRSRENPLI
jgi:O-antigen/teichoic acid export membrane protein